MQVEQDGVASSPWWNSGDRVYGPRDTWGLVPLFLGTGMSTFRTVVKVAIETFRY